MFLLPVAAHAQLWSGILNPARATDWSGVGVPSGIPSRTVLCSTLGTSGLSSSTVQSVTTIQINSALAGCASGQVVLLNPGTYNTNGGCIIIPSNVVLRGSGPTKTIINTTGSASCGIVSFGNGGGPNSGNSTAITGGTAQNSKSITVASASGISVGMLMTLSQNDSAIMTNQGDNGTCSWCNGGIGGLSGQTVQVTSISGTTIGISEPLYLAYTNGGQAAYPYNAACANAGLENLHLTAQPNTGYNPNINMVATVNSWVKNVESDFANGAHMHIDWSLHDTIQDSFFHDGYSHGPGTEDDQLRLSYKSSANLIQNNILWRQHVSIMLEWGASGNVIAYNYSTGAYDAPTGTFNSWLISDIDATHGANPMFNLFEGNITTHFQADSVWGSANNDTLFRTLSTGSNKGVPPINARGALNLGAANQQTGNAVAYSIDWTAQNYNLVGILAGSDFAINSQGYSSIRKSPTAAGSGGGPTCIAVGYMSGSGTHTPNNTDSTMLYTNVFNCGVNTFTNPAALPSSFYLSARPTWWSGTWPPIGPDVVGGNFTDWENPSASTLHGFVNVIPALTCFNSATSNGTTNVTTFDGSVCYVGSGGPPPPPPPPPSSPGGGAVCANGCVLSNGAVIR